MKNKLITFVLVAVFASLMAVGVNAAGNEGNPTAGVVTTDDESEEYTEILDCISELLDDLQNLSEQQPKSRELTAQEKADLLDKITDALKRAFDTLTTSGKIAIRSEHADIMYDFAVLFNDLRDRMFTYITEERIRNSNVRRVPNNNPDMLSDDIDQAADLLSEYITELNRLLDNNEISGTKKVSVITRLSNKLQIIGEKYRTTLPAPVAGNAMSDYDEESDPRRYIYGLINPEEAYPRSLEPKTPTGVAEIVEREEQLPDPRKSFDKSQEIIDRVTDLFRQVTGKDTQEYHVIVPVHNPASNGAYRRMIAK